MALDRNTHYELHGQRGSQWSLLDIFENKDEASREADRVFRAGGYRCVRLLREHFDEDSEEFKSVETLFLGRRYKPSKYDEEQHSPYCRKHDELYSFQSRKLIGRLLAPSLESWEMTPLELLHNIENYMRLQSAGTAILNAVQRTAVQQVRRSGQPVTQRIRELFAVVDEAVTALRDVKVRGIPDLSASRFATVLEELNHKDDHSRILGCSLAQDLRQYEGAIAKAERLISLLRLDHPQWAMRTLDSFLSEQLMFRRLIRHLLPSDNLVEQLQKLAALSRGTLREEDGTDIAHVLNGYFRSQYLPASRAALVFQIYHCLDVNRRLKDDDILEECTALYEIFDGIGETIDADLPDKSLAELLEERMARLLNPQTLGEYIAEGRNPAERLQRLIDLERRCIGVANRRILANYMLPLLHDSANEAFWLEPLSSGYQGRMKLLARLQGRILRSDLQDLHKEKLAARLDELCSRLLDDSGLLRRLERSPASASEKGTRLLNLMADGHFTKGKARETIEAQACHHMADPEFLSPVVRASTPEARELAVKKLKKLLSEAGVAAPGSL